MLLKTHKTHTRKMTKRKPYNPNFLKISILHFCLASEYPSLLLPDKLTGKQTFFIGTIPNLAELMKPTEDIIRFTFLPVIRGGNICSDHDPILLSLLARFDKLGVPMFHETACFKYKTSRKLSSSLSKTIEGQSLVYYINNFQQKKLKNEIKTKRDGRYKNTKKVNCKTA